MTYAENLHITIITSVITVLIAIAGFIITITQNKSNIKTQLKLQEENFKKELNKQELNFFNEINKQKSSINLDKISDLPFKVLKLFDKIISSTKSNSNAKKLQDTFLNDFQEIMALVFAYGTKEAICIVTNMQEHNFHIGDNSESLDKNKIMAYYILLVCQIKYDLTGIEINPEYFFRMRLTDYPAVKNDMTRINNEIVKKLFLKDFLNIA